MEPKMTDEAPPIANASFFGTLVRWIVSLPIDIKILIEMIGDNQLDMKARSLAVGTIAYLIAAIDMIPDTIPALGYVDDVLVLHIALAIILQIDPERAEHYREKYPSTIGAIDEQVQLLTDTLGALYSWLKAFVENLSRRGYKGQSAEEAAQSEETREEIFDDAMIFAAGINVDEELIRNRLLTAPPNQLVNLLSDGLEKEQQRQEQQENKGVAGLISAGSSGVRRLLDFGKKG
jgi:uncharacterized membrane protein YkvA (DUF1232 family)